MKRYRFRLATVLRVRRTEEEAAKHELRMANLALRQAVTARDLADGRYRNFTSRGPEVASAAQLHAERLQAGLLAEQLATAQRLAMERASVAAVAQARWSKAAKRVAVLERLAARRLAEHAAEEARAEIASVDDLVTARYVAEQVDEDHSGITFDVSQFAFGGPVERRQAMAGQAADRRQPEHAASGRRDVR